MNNDDFEGLDFNPILNNIEGLEKNELIDISKSNSNKEDIDCSEINSKEALSMNNLVDSTMTHILGAKKCKRDLTDLNNVLESIKDKMSIRELLEYHKIRLAEWRFHEEFIRGAYNYILKTELAKSMLLGSSKAHHIVDINERKHLNELLRLLQSTK
jgi:hypothetical protein